MASIIPEVLNHFNIYNGANALVGVSGEVELPELEAMPKVGASVLVVHLSNGSAMGIVAGTYWNSSHRPPVSGKGVYRKDLAQAIGEAFLQYSGSSLQIHAPAITLDASRITLATKSGSITVAEIINHIKG